MCSSEPETYSQESFQSKRKKILPARSKLPYDQKSLSRLRLLYLQDFRICVRKPGARFTKYLTTMILRLPCDNAKVTIDLRRTSNLKKNLRRTRGFSRVQFTCKIIRSSETVFVDSLRYPLEKLQHVESHYHKLILRKIVIFCKSGSRGPDS